MKYFRTKSEILAEQEALTELSKGTLGRYVKKASDETQYKSYLSGRYMDTNPDQSNKHWNKSKNRIIGIIKAVDRLTKEEQEQTNEDLGVRTISTFNKKKGDNVATMVVNKRRITKADRDAKWKRLVADAAKKVDEEINLQEERVFVEVKSREAAKKRCPWAAVIAKVEGGYMAFRYTTDYDIWKRQK